MKDNLIIKIHRISHNLYSFKLTRFLSILIYFFNRIIFNCVLHPSTKIGKNVKFGLNGFGTIIHKNCQILDNTYIGANVLLGGNAKEIGAPIIHGQCIIFSNSIILGNINIRPNSIVGAGSFIINDIPENCLVAGNPAKIKKKNIKLSEYSAKIF